MAEIAPDLQTTDETRHDASPAEIVTPEYTPEKVRVFLLADEDTQEQIAKVYDTLKTEYGELKLRRIYDDITGIPIATLGTETQLRRVARANRKRDGADPGFLESLSDSLLGKDGSIPEEVVFDGPRARWTKADRVSMLVSGFDAAGPRESCARIKNEVLRNLQQYLLDLNSRNTSDVMRVGGVDWIHQPAPYLPLARPSRRIGPSERTDMERTVSKHLPEKMRFVPYVAVPEPIDCRAVADHEEESIRAALKQSGPAAYGSVVVSLLERGLAVINNHPQARVELLDREVGRYIELRPEEAHWLRRHPDRFSGMTVSFRR